MELLGKYKTIYSLDAVKKYFYVYKKQNTGSIHIGYIVKILKYRKLKFSEP
jgi:hypothetical protein